MTAVVAGRQDANLGVTHAPTRVLIVEDNVAERLRLRVMLERAGFSVSEAENGAQALTLLAGDPLDLVISDWEMPEVDGLELCRRARTELGLEGMYFIILTGHGGDANLVRAFEAGADDFLSKPVKAEELRVRLGAGQRICSLQARLAEQLHQVNTDMEAAGVLQQEVLPAACAVVGDVDLGFLFQPATELGGDMLNYVSLGDQRLAFYLLDVCGHGAAAAMLSFAVSHSLTQLLRELPADQPWDPHSLIEDLNQRFLDRSDKGRFFTMALGCLERDSGVLKICQAGHPPGLIVRATGEITPVAGGGVPVGVFDWASYETTLDRLEPGDRLLLYSDGVTEANNPEQQEFGEEALKQLLVETQTQAVPEALRVIEQRCAAWLAGVPNDDDLSLLMVARRGEGG